MPSGAGRSGVPLGVRTHGEGVRTTHGHTNQSDYYTSTHIHLLRVSGL